MKKINNKSIIIRVLLVIIIASYFVFLYMDLFKVQGFLSSSDIKFLSMILVICISAITGNDSISRRDNLLLKTGLLITLIADVFLLLLNNYYILGIGLFCIVQILYSVRYKVENTKIIIRNFSIIFITLFIIYIVIDQFIIKIDFLIMIVLFYAICLLSSTNKAIQIYNNKSYPNLNSKMIAGGMVLFLLCDINVAVYNIIESMVVSNRFIILLGNISFISMWFFYLPSQVLLSLSGYKCIEGQ